MNINKINEMQDEMQDEMNEITKLSTTSAIQTEMAKTLVHIKYLLFDIREKLNRKDKE